MFVSVEPSEHMGNKKNIKEVPLYQLLAKELNKHNYLIGRRLTPAAGAADCHFENPDPDNSKIKNHNP